MGDFVMIIGAIVALIGALDFMNAEKMKDIKVTLAKVISGGIVAGVGYALSRFGV